MAKKRQNDYFAGIYEGLAEVADSFEKGKKLTSRTVSLPSPPHKMNAQEIADLRENKLNVSQRVFAQLLNVSPKTVQAWEQSANTPSGAALRLLWLIKSKPDVIKFILT